MRSVHLKGGGYIRFSSRFNCNYIAHIPPYHVCTKNNNSISARDMRTTSKYHPGVVRVFEESKDLRSVRFNLNDPDINEQIIYIGQGKTGARSYSSDLTHNLFSLWERGITGRGVVVAVVDDGIDVNHQELAPNLDLDLSYNFVHNIPSPHTTKEVHGTKCGGLISAKANNGKCGVGSAPESVLVALKVLSASIGEVSDSNEARAFNHRMDRIQIMSMSWGPLDDGIGIGRPNELASRAFQIGITSGRSGKGIIYIFPSGNGRRNFDFCGFDGYLQKYSVFVIGSSSKYGKMPPYAERCTAIIASTLSNSNSLPENKIYTTYPLNKCGRYHTGTSVSAPIASGILALVLQVNPNLTRRDIQDMIVRTSTQIDPYPIVEMTICSTPSFKTNQGPIYGGAIHSSAYGKVELLSWSFKIYGSLDSSIHLHNSHSLFLSRFCLPVNFKKDPKLELFCVKTSKEINIDSDCDPYAYIDSLSIIWQQPKYPNIYGISFLTSIVLVFCVLSLLIVIIHRITYRKFIACPFDSENKFLISRD
ncbi:hypothetical protein MXB_1702 [Myxobolus squamalis]|nr:hypothetical protein MXB_1702 [Myxobolus squamalis]